MMKSKYDNQMESFLFKRLESLKFAFVLYTDYVEFKNKALNVKLKINTHELYI